MSEQRTIEQKLTAKPCPCGCRKWIVAPLFYCVEASVDKEDADELVRRWNAYTKLRDAIEYALPFSGAATREVLERAMEETS